MIPAIQSIATSTGVLLIDSNTPLLKHVELFNDGVHPSSQGAGVIAATVSGVLSNPKPHTRSGSVPGTRSLPTTTEAANVDR